MKKKFLITSALPYVNNFLHIGHMVGCFLPSDIYARFTRAKYGAENVLFVCGSDDHGTASIVGAKKENLSVEDYVDKYRALHEKSMQDFDMSFDGGYGRTHTKFQQRLVQSLFSRLDSGGFIEERETLQPYGVKDKMFLADRQIEGTCPKCGYENARGDQCDQCYAVYEPNELINPRSSATGGPVEMRPTKNLFYLAHKIKPQLERWLADNMEKNGWPRGAIAATKKYLTEEIPDPSVTRDLSWGIPVNKPGYENKVFYVWFDAPWGYVSISQAANKNWADWWHGGENCHYVQFMGKDNIKFHSMFFPGQEIALDDEWKKVDLLKALSFLNFEGNKISKSTGNGIFLEDAIRDAPSDAWRYALMASAPETDDTDFTIRRFADIVNKDLNGMLGNFVSRVCKMTEKNFGASVPNAGQGAFDIDADVNAKLAELTAALEACEFRNAISALRGLWALGNEFMTRAEPWALIKNGDLKRAGAVLNECFQLIDFYARTAAPFIPTTANKMLDIFRRPTSRDLSWPDRYERRIADGAEFIVPENLFERIDDDKVNAMVEKYTKKTPKVVIAKILTVEPHPDSDHLHVLTVDDGAGKPQTVVCGAPNVRVGLVGVWAKPGANLPAADLTLTARKVRGVLSNGMMCAADELGIGEDHEIIVELPENSKIGEEFKM
ncbi:MAG: methionine--tRNA ligase [Rickettsiales bacterium]|jgi:methionyl-tRNA synthetase|nr:methionine--tRNA ligase [Rickettsiales bacterium]